MFLFHGSKLITFCVMRIFVDPCVLSRIGLGSQVYKVSEPGKPGFKGLSPYVTASSKSNKMDGCIF